MSAWIDSNRDSKRRRRNRKTAYKPAGSAAPQSAGPTKRSGKRNVGDVDPSTPAQPNSAAGTPLRIPYGNKEVAMKLGARYCSAGWYAPPGVDLSEFGKRGWLTEVPPS
jgi:DNA topoisomerase III